jgi:acyl-CoA thioesterase II
MTHELLEFLNLEQIDRDLFRGPPGLWPADRRTLYGGEVASQALMAASLTVTPDRLPHSLHGYYLRRGDPTKPVLFRVDRDRDGRSFSARRVAAIQNGEVIWEMSCSFHVDERGPEYIPPIPAELIEPENAIPSSNQWCSLLDVRIGVADVAPGATSDDVNRLWMRVVAPLPDDPVLHACLHTFTSDGSAGFGSLAAYGIPPHGPSIDHSVWFHNRASRADDWVIYEMTPAKVGTGRGVYTGTAHSLDGNLVLMFAQEMLLRG